MYFTIFSVVDLKAISCTFVANLLILIYIYTFLLDYNLKITIFNLLYICSLTILYCNKQATFVA